MVSAQNGTAKLKRRAQELRTTCASAKQFPGNASSPAPARGWSESPI